MFTAASTGQAMLALLELALSRPEFRERIPNAHLVVGPGGEPWEGREPPAGMSMGDRRTAS